MNRKIITLLFGTALTVILMLAAGGIYIMPQNLLLVYMYADLWNAVGGLFSFMLVPGFTVGYALCQSRILGAVYFTAFVALGFTVGINTWWIITAVLLILSYIFCIRKHVGNYDELNTFDRFCVLIPAFGALRFTDIRGFRKFFGIIAKFLSVLAIILNFVLLTALWIIPKDSASVFGKIILQIKDFGGTLFGLTVIFVFLPMFSVYSAKYSFIKPGLAKILAVIFGGYDIMRGAFVTLPALLSGLKLTTDTTMEGASPIFNNMFGIEACFLAAMLFGGILCVKAAFGKKLSMSAHFCLTKDGTVSLRCLMMAAFNTVLVLSIAPAAIFTIWLVFVIIFLLISAWAIKNFAPYYSYEDLRSMGYSDYEARKFITLANGKVSVI